MINDSFNTFAPSRCLEKEEPTGTMPQENSVLPAEPVFTLIYHKKVFFSGPLLPGTSADYLLHVNDSDLHLYLEDLGRQAIRFALLDNTAPAWAQSRTSTIRVYVAGFHPCSDSPWQ